MNPKVACSPKTLFLKILFSLEYAQGQVFQKLSVIVTAQVSED